MLSEFVWVLPSLYELDEQIPRDSDPTERQASPQSLTRTLATGFLVWPQEASNLRATSFQSVDLHVPSYFPPKR